MDRSALSSQLQQEVDRIVTSTDIVDAVFAAFLDANQKSYQVFFSDSCCSLTLRGPVFDTAMPLLEWSGDDSIGIHLSRIQAVFTCERYAVAVQGSASSKGNCRKSIKTPVLYLEYRNGSNSGLFNLVEISAGLHSPSEEKVPTSLLANDLKAMDSELQLFEHQQTRVLFFKPMKFVIDDSKANLLSPVETDVVALPVSLAIECHQYSETDWLSRNQTWLSPDVARQAVDSIVYAVPAFTVNTSCSTNLPDINDMQWRFDFSNVEAVLIADWSRAAKLAYHILLRVIPTVCRVESCLFPFDVLVKYAIFWTMERSVINKSLEAGNIVTWCLSVCDTLESFVQAKHFPHYFMPNVNVLCRFIGSSCNLNTCNHSKQDTNLYHDYIPATMPKSHCGANHMVFGDHVVKVAITRQLEDVFKQTVSLLNLQLYQRIHSSASAACRIRLHCEAIAHLQNSVLSFPRDVIEGIAEWITSSLGIEYETEAIISRQSTPEKNRYLMKAEECLLQNQNLQSVSLSLMCVANSANHLIKSGKVLDALSILRNPSLFRCTPDHLEDIELDKQTFPDRFTALWLHVIHTTDSMFSENVKPALLKEFASSLPLMECQILGATEYPVFIIRSKFLIFYLTAQCHKLLNQQNEMLDLLVHAESTADTWVMNVAEDRNQIAYLNLLAGLYADINHMSEAIRLFEKSRSIMKNPRNTAHWSMIAIQTRQWFRKMLKRWISIVTGAVAGVLILKYVYRY